MRNKNVGVGLADEMIKPQYDEHGEYYPPYAFNNAEGFDSDYLTIQPKDAAKILVGIKASGPLNSKIHGNAYARINGGMIRFLISEQEAKSALMATQVGQKMTTMERVQRLIPHEMTSRLFDEMSNLRLKRTGSSTDIVLEQINARHPKDKYSSFAYGLWRIKQHEEEETKRGRRRGKNGEATRKLTFFN